jgi:threonylcarbamoyladenosine tRNA methylthiotransferase MtaB
MVGKKLDVLCEHQNENGLIKGFSSNYVRVALPFDESLINKVISVEIADTYGHLCYTVSPEK